MPYPDKPSITTSYTARAQALGDGTLPGIELDVDLEALRASLNDYIDWVRGITRSDGRLANGSVTRDTLGADILVGFDPPTAWATGTDYALNDTVFEGNRFYICTAAHTSGTFNTDLGADRWALLADFTNVAAGLFTDNQIVEGDWRFDGEVNVTGPFRIDGAAVTAAGAALLDDADAAAQRATLGAQAQSATLDTLASATAAGLALMDDADAAAQRATLGVPDAVETLTNKTFGDGTAASSASAPATSGTVTLDPANGLIQWINMTGNVTIGAVNLEAGESMVLRIADGTGHTINWNGLVNWESDDGSAPVLQTGGYTWITLWSLGGTAYGFASNGA